MLFSRGNAVRSWEISFTNEFLTWMERFRGILICTTNRIKGLDEASIRRFNHKMEFDYLTGEGNVIFYEKMLQPMMKKPLDDGLKRELAGIANLAPGDFKVVRDRFSFYPAGELSHALLIHALGEESGIKKAHRGKTICGFTPKDGR